MTNKETITHDPALVVGIGASAGGLTALKRFFRAVPGDMGIAFVVVQHLEPTHKSLLAEILEGEARSKLTIVEAKDGMRIEPEHVYIIHPAVHLAVSGYQLEAAQRPAPNANRSVIDQLFRSIAQHHGARGVGIVLSGYGADGTAGLRAIRAAGGLAMVQDPETADYDAMPSGAINAGVSDWAAALEELPQKLIDYRDHFAIPWPTKADDPRNDHFAAITKLLKTKEGFDLRQYKESTVQRRICRRLGLTGERDLRAYIELLQEDEEERQLLLRDLLINVTHFYRDPDAFETLAHSALSRIVSRAEDGAAIRVWVPGCATGEEAYTIAMLILERMEEAGKNLDLKVFATDADDDAIRQARRGVFDADAVAELPRHLVEKYFRPAENNSWKVNSRLRDVIAFATQNVVSDPPFSRMDLISCRNVLIYLKRTAQERVLRSFYFALKPHGFLFLGNSESVSKQKDWFQPVSQKWRLFTRQNGDRSHETAVIDLESSGSPPRRSRERVARGHATPSPADLAKQALLACVPPAVVINEQNQVLYVHGDVSRYVKVHAGEPSLDFVQLLDSRLRSRLRSAIFKARRSKEKAVTFAPQEFNGQEEAATRLKISMCPVFQDGCEGNLVVTFEAVPLDKAPASNNGYTVANSDQEKMIEAMERELRETREELQNTVEELETSTEELKASHEEALSTNEELQSANEELEASTEELRSLNEELATVNAQLKGNIAELETAHNDLANFMASTNLATLFLDSQLKIKRFTPAAETLLHISPRHQEIFLHDVNRPLLDSDAIKEAKRVLETFEISEADLQTPDGVWYHRRILPYRAEGRRVDGVVITFTNITELKFAATALSIREQQQAIVAKLGLDALVGDDIHRLMERATREVANILKADMCKLVEYRPREQNFVLRTALGFSNVEVGKTIVPADLNSQAGYTLQEHHPVIVEDLSTERRFNGPELLLSHGVVSGMSCVIADGEIPYGVIGVHTREKRVFTDDDANFLTSIANLLSIAIHRQRAQSLVLQSRERLNLACEAANLGIYDFDLETNTATWDGWVRHLWGFDESKERVAFDHFFEAIIATDRERVRRAVDLAIANRSAGGELKIEYRIQPKNGGIRWIEATGKTFYQGNQAVRIVGTVQDISKRKRVELDLQESEQKLRIATDSNKFGVFDYDISTGELELDPILKHIWGLEDSAEIDIDMFYGGVHPDDVEKTQRAIEAAIDPKTDGRFYAVYRVVNMKSRALSWVEASGQVVFEQGEAQRMFGMVIDITERKVLENSLQTAINKLAEENTKKNEFIATLGHELRNPLAAINSGIQILQLGTDDTRWALEMMANNVRLTCSLLDDLLDLTRVSLGKIRLKKSSVDLNRLLIDSRESFVAKAAEKRQRLIYNIPAEQIYVHGDRTRLEQVFGNILANAEKFTPEGGIIEVTLSQVNGAARVEVRDNGIGIPAERLDCVFEPFEQLSSSGSNSGLGIGLSLVKEFVRLHDGTIKVASGGLGKGCTFTVTLPLSARPPRSDQGSRSNVAKPKPGLRVMLVDDNADAAAGLQAMLQMEACEVLTLHAAEQALAQVAAFAPEAFVLDIGLPDMTGYELLVRLREEYRKDALYVALTGYNRGDDSQRSAAERFDEYLTKPAKFADILAALSRVE